MRVVRGAVLAACVLIAPLAMAGPYPVLSQELTMAGTSGLGDAIAVDGGWMVVGAPADREKGPDSGAVHLYRQTILGWDHHVKIPSWSTGGAGRFGDAVALSGDWLAVGAPREGHSSGQGWVYLYQRQGTDWVPMQFLNGPSFGHALAFDGDMLFVGEFQNHDLADHSGAVQVYRRVGSLWNHHATLYPSVPRDFQAFGFKLDTSPGRLVVSATPADEAYIFERRGTTWTESARIVIGSRGMQFGFGTALDGDTLVLSTSNGQATGLLGPLWGNALVYTFDGTSWEFQQNVRVLHGQDSPGFGRTAALRGDTLVIGAPGEDHGASDSGRAYLFVRVNGVWAQQAVIDPPRVGSGQMFGQAVALTADEVLIGAPGDDGAAQDAGAAMVYHHPSTS